MHRSCLTAALALLAGCSGQRSIQQALDAGSGTVTLPAGIVEIGAELKTPPNAHDLEIVGSQGTMLKAAPNFQGRSLIFVQGAARVKLRNFAIDGNRKETERATEMPSASSPFLIHFQGNGIVVENSKDVTIENIAFEEVSGFPILASRVKKILVAKVSIGNSGGRNNKGRNNTSGGILLEEGTDDFEVRDSTLFKVYGNGIWTHSTYQSPRNYRGRIANNTFELIGRDAIQVGHANRVIVEGNTGKMIGYPFNIVDIENGGTPVAIDTAGKFDEGVYRKNRFEEINGKCFDLDGFHDGEVSENVCFNRGGAADYPNGHYGLVMNNTNLEMRSQLITIRGNTFDGTKFGGIFIIGKGHKVFGNKLLNLNRWNCNEGLKDNPCPFVKQDPGLTRAGIFLGEKAEHRAPAEENVIEDNEITGYQMAENCILASARVSPAANIVRNNRCADTK